eukprot:TRINITY_DN18548_c0_g2_i1.p1 TRINITY_DN18548_c0_g2~~TRINITY_DN18548_c0_g2_i1.p1  ORF type:complete len:934 (-),score=175.78 TRINITY_DN18548_c0_g2_i1:267-3068(-)
MLVAVAPQQRVASPSVCRRVEPEAADAEDHAAEEPARGGLVTSPLLESFPFAGSDPRCEKSPASDGFAADASSSDEGERRLRALLDERKAEQERVRRLGGLASQLEVLEAQARRRAVRSSDAAGVLLASTDAANARLAKVREASAEVEASRASAAASGRARATTASEPVIVRGGSLVRAIASATAGSGGFGVGRRGHSARTRMEAAEPSSSSTSLPQLQASPTSAAASPSTTAGGGSTSSGAAGAAGASGSGGEPPRASVSICALPATVEVAPALASPSGARSPIGAGADRNAKRRRSVMPRGVDPIEEERREYFREAIRTEIITRAGGARAAFKSLDVNGSDKVSFQELVDGMEALGVDWRRITSFRSDRELMSLFDRDRDGVISLPELLPDAVGTRLSTPDFCRRYNQRVEFRRVPLWQPSSPEGELEALLATSEMEHTQLRHSRDRGAMSRHSSKHEIDVVAASAGALLRHSSKHDVDIAMSSSGLDPTKLPPVSVDMRSVPSAARNVSTSLLSCSRRPSASSAKPTAPMSAVKLAPVQSASSLLSSSRVQSLQSPTSCGMPLSTSLSLQSATSCGMPLSPSLSPNSTFGNSRSTKPKKDCRRFWTDSCVDKLGEPEEPVSTSIRRCDSISDVYCLKGQVMESVHKGMDIRYGYKKSDPDKHGVVVKVRNKALSFRQKSDEDAWRASSEFLLEASKYPGIARVLEVLEDDVAYYVVMEKVHGLDLHDTLSAEGNMSMQQIKDVLRQLLGGLAELHERGYVHNDLKLENVMIERTKKRRPTGTRRRANSVPGVVKLIDFDTVKEVKMQSGPSREVVGTDQYIAPEAYKGYYSPASDVFAAGVISYKLLTGSFPFDDNIFVLDKTRSNTVGSEYMESVAERLFAFNIDWSHAVFQAEPGAQLLLSKMLARNPLKRPSVKDIMKDAWLDLPNA